jgi:hypothetical protein
VVSQRSFITLTSSIIITIIIIIIIIIIIMTIITFFFINIIRIIIYHNRPAHLLQFWETVVGLSFGVVAVRDEDTAQVEEPDDGFADDEEREFDAPIRVADLELRVTQSSVQRLAQLLRRHASSAGLRNLRNNQNEPSHRIMRQPPRQRPHLHPFVIHLREAMGA